MSEIQCPGCDQMHMYRCDYDRYCLDCHNYGVPGRDETIQDLRARIEHLRKAIAKDEWETSQVLGKALKYPWCKDDQENFPGATEADGVCTGEHVAATLASEAAARIASLEAENERLRGLLHDALAWLYGYSTCRLPYGEDRSEFERAAREFCQRAESELERKP